MAGDVEDVGTDDLGDVGKDLGQPVGVVLFVDVLDVALALVLGDGVAHVVDVEAQRLGEVVEALELQARQGLDHGGHSSRFRWTKGELCAQPAGRRKGLRLLDEHRPPTLGHSPVDDAHESDIRGFHQSLLPKQLESPGSLRTEEHRSELQSLMRISNAVFTLKKKKN